MRSLSPACRRSPRIRGPVGRIAGCPSPRWLLLGAMLLLGLTGALGVQAAGLPQPPSTAPRPGSPAGSGCAVAPLAPASPRAGLVDDASVCQALAEVPAGTTVAIAGATGLPAGTFRGVAADLPTAAEPPPAPRPPLASATLVPAANPEPAPPIAGVLVAPAAAGNQGAPEKPSIPQNPATPAASPAPANTNSDSSLSAPHAPVAPREAVSPVGTPPAAATPAAVVAKPAAPAPHPALAFDGAAAVPSQPFGKLIYQIARSYALNPLLVAAIAKVESDFNPHARSRKGACGLMQVLPSTARRFGLPRHRDLFNPRKNLEAATRYLRWLVDRFGDDPVRVLAAYNAGEGAVDRFGGVPPFAETRDYVQRIFGLLGFPLLLDPPAAAPEPPQAAAAPAGLAALSAIAGAR